MIRPSDGPASPPPGIAVIGCGAWGRNLARCFAELGALAAISDHHADAAESLAARLGTRVLPAEAAIADPAVTAVAIATQPSSHHALAAAALAAGRDVFVEKPLALDLAEAEALVARAGAAGRVLMVGHILRYHPAFEALLGLARAGRLGRLLRIETRRLNLGAVRQEESALWCLAPHDISMVLALAGAAPGRVDAFADRPLGRPIADGALIRLGFPGGLAAQIEVSWLQPVKQHRLAVIGDAGMAVFDDTLPWPEKLVLHSHRVALDGPAPRFLRGETEAVDVAPAEPLMAECAHFLDRLRSREAPVTGGAEALAVMDVLARADRAIAGDASLLGSASLHGGSAPVTKADHVPADPDSLRRSRLTAAPARPRRR